MLDFLKKTVFSVHTNLDFVHEAHIKVSYYCLWFMIMAILNGHCSNGSPVIAGLPQGSIFLIYINDLPEGLQSSVKLFADDTSLFQLIMSADQLDKDLKNISDWTYKRKIVFDPDLSKQAQEVIFSRKTNKINHPTTTFNTILLAHTPYQKHIGLYLDE